MTPNFETASREYVEERLEGHDSVHSVAPCGDGLQVVYKSMHAETRTYTSLMEQTGWYVASYEASTAGDTVILMPVTEVGP